ncbi:hypothetical protein D3C80_340750 [compost metagenome]
MTDEDADQHAAAQHLLDVGPGEGGRLRHCAIFHAGQAAAGFDVVQLGLVDAGMIDRAAHHLPEDESGDQAQTTHDEEDRVPVKGMDQPAHEGGEDDQRKVLRRVEDGRGRAALGAREPGGDQPCIAREGGAFGQADHEAHGEQARKDQTARQEA